MALHEEEVIHTTRHVELMECLTTICITYIREHFTHFYARVDEQEDIETFNKFRDFEFVVINLYDAITNCFHHTDVHVG